MTEGFVKNVRARYSFSVPERSYFFLKRLSILSMLSPSMICTPTKFSPPSGCLIVLSSSEISYEIAMLKNDTLPAEFHALLGVSYFFGFLTILSFPFLLPSDTVPLESM